MEAWECVSPFCITNCWGKSGIQLKNDASSSDSVSSVDASGGTDDNEFTSTVGLTTEEWVIGDDSTEEKILARHVIVDPDISTLDTSSSSEEEEEEIRQPTK